MAHNLSLSWGLNPNLSTITHQADCLPWIFWGLVKVKLQVFRIVWTKRIGSDSVAFPLLFALVTRARWPGILGPTVGQRKILCVPAVIIDGIIASFSKKLQMIVCSSSLCMFVGPSWTSVYGRADKDCFNIDSRWCDPWYTKLKKSLWRFNDNSVAKRALGESPRLSKAIMQAKCWLNEQMQKLCRWKSETMNKWKNGYVKKWKNCEKLENLCELSQFPQESLVWCTHM